MTVQDYELLLRVRADLQQALQGMNGLSDKLGQVDKQARAAGESADQATARIRAMVAATAQQSKLQESIRSTHERAAAAINATLHAYDNQTAAIDRTSEAVAAYRAQIGKRTESAAAAAGIRAQTAEMAKLAAQIDPTIAALDKLDKQEASLRKMHSAGIVGEEDFKRFSAVIENNRLALTRTGESMIKFSLNTAGARREVGRLASDIANGNWGRFDQTALTLANYSGLMSAVFSPLGLAIAAVTASLGAFAIGAAEGWKEEEKLRVSLIATGGAAGTTAAALDREAQFVGATTGKWGDARKAVEFFAASGKVAGASLGKISEAAVNIATVTGQSVEKAAQSLIDLAEKPAETVAKLNEQYHFLTSSQYAEIAALQDQGNASEAARLAEQAYTSAMASRAQEVQDNAGWMVRSARWVRNAWETAWNAVKDVGKPLDLQQKIDALHAQIKTLTTPHLDRAGNEVLGQGNQQEVAKLKAQIEVLRHQQVEAGLKTVSDQLSARANSDAIAAQRRLSAFKDPKAKHDDAIKQAKLDKARALYGIVDPAERAKIEDEFKAEVKRADDTYAAALKKRLPHARKTSDAAAISAGHQLIKMLNDEQGALDPVARAWADYNDKVNQANQLADKARKARGADVTAINAQRAAVIAEAAAVRDAAIAENAKKDRAAFEKLQQSLENTNGIKFDQLTSQLESLQKWLAKGVITATEYHAAVQGVLNTGLQPLPKYKGLGAAVGGAFGELDKIKAQTDQLDTAYAAQLRALNTWHDKSLLSNQDYVAKENALYKQYYAEKGRLQEASNTAILTGMSASLEESARLLMNSVGKNTEAYRIAFAASKGAAIAQATVNMFKAMSNAGADVPWPGNLVAIANVGASMAVLISQIASLGSGFSQGGYTGPGGVNQPAGIVHAGEVVFSQHDVARHGGVAAVESLRLHGYAEGGIVWPAPQPAPETPISAAMANAAARHRDGGTAAPNLALRIVNHVDPQVTYDAMSSPDGETVILNTIARNATRVRQSIGGH